MGTPRGSLVPLDADSLKTEVQLRVTPLELQFSDAVPGRVYRLPFTVRNLGRGNRKIRFKEPSKPQFKLLLTNLDKELAPGLQMTAVVEYRPDKYEDTFDQLVISSGNKIQEIPLIGLIPFCKLEIESTVVDFGTLVSNSKVHSKEINIINHGKVPGMFNIDYQGQLPVLFFPTYGAVKPKSSVIIRVDFCADQPNLVNEVAKVSLQGRPDIFLNIQAHVVEQIIELFNMNNDSKLECIRFGPIFFGTSKIEHALLYNNSPEPINWVAVIENDCVGEELGANIRQRTDFALDNLTYLSKIKKIDVTTIVSCVPNEGALLPYQKTVIRLGFTPKLVVDDEKNVDPSHRQDYAFFMRFDTIGSKDGFLSDDNHKNIKSDQFQKVELALTGSGLPVLLRLDPEKFLNFSPCAVGEYSEAVCIIENQSKFLPVTYNFPKTAHFKIEPESGKISEGCTQSVKCSFTPHQIGVFKKKQVIEIIGPVADENFQSSSMKPFHYLYLNFNSVCTTVTKDIVMEANTGISPLVSNPAGHFVVKDVAKYKDCPPVAVLQSAKTKLHDHRLNENKSLKNALVALPNDRAASIRPGERDKCYRTIFTKIPRYNYVDPDFEYTELEKKEQRTNQNYYSNYIKNLRSMRPKKQAEREDIHPSNDKDIDMNSCNDADIDRHPSNDTDTEIEPSFDLTPPLVSQEEIEDSLTECPIKANRLLTTRELASKEAQTLHQKVLKALKSRPCTVQEKHDCSIILTPKQIHQVIVGPSVLNFGNICVNSRNTHLLHVVNMLSMHILIRLDANFEELQKTKQFSYVIPPTSTTYLPVVFESSAIGKFWKSFTFTVNNAPGGHILVMADVFSIKLELSSNTIVLKPRGFLLKSCFWGTVTLYNHLNLPAQFGWQPVNSIKGIAFSIRPDKGVVEAYSSLHCEVMWRPGFCYSEEGEFVLHVRDGNTLMLKCVTQFGHTEASFLEPKTVFDNSPQGLTTWRQAVLYNLGYNHAYFKVSEQSLLPIINIVPSQGVIPFGGVTILNISCTPFVVEKFETKAKIIIHGGNTVDIRIVGFVEIADVEIKPNVLKFSGTYAGTTDMIPFVVKNKRKSRATVEFSLEDFPEFSVDSKDKSGKFIKRAPQMYFLDLEGNSSLECCLSFSPKIVRVYDFSFQIQINSFKSSEFYTEYLSKKDPSIPKTVPLIQPCIVHATVLKAPLKLSSTEFVFNVHLHEMDSIKNVIKSEDLMLHNLSRQKLLWRLDISRSAKLFEKCIFNFSARSRIMYPKEKSSIFIIFSPKKPGKYTVDVPMYLNDSSVCYRVIRLTGEVKSPKLMFDPPFIHLTPVPLDVTTGIDVKVISKNYFRNSIVSFQIPTVRLLNDDGIHPLSVTFPKGRTIIGSKSGVNNEIICHVSFKSSKPVSFFSNLLFHDGNDNWYSVPVTATAENCILTIYPYLATYLNNSNIILKDDVAGRSAQTGGSFLISSKNSTLLPTATTTKFKKTEPTKGNLFLGMELICEDVDAGEKPQTDSCLEKEEKKEQFFPEEGSKAYKFFQKVVNAAETWFSHFGWPEGPHLLSIPETIRRDVQKVQLQSLPRNAFKKSDFFKHSKTIYDVLHHLSGKMPSGVNASQYLPEDHTERVRQLHLQYSSLLNFINTQGGCISHVLPEFLFEPEDYKKWLEISSPCTAPSSSCMLKERCSVVFDMDKFESLSKRAWTDVFLQIYKVLVLSRILPRFTSAVPMVNVHNTPKFNPNFVSSNIYSDAERILLSWLNTNYENTRRTIWKNSQTGAIPSEKWIVNFDKDLLDGLVFASQLATYCPFLIETHLVNMYTRPNRPEQCLHNCLIIANCFNELGFEMNIQAIDICDPNPVLMLMLCAYMYERLPAFLPKNVVPFRCALHDTVLREIILKNPSSQSIVYTPVFVGRDASDFSLTQSGNVKISPKNEITITVKFTSHFLRPATASLLLISKCKHRAEVIPVTFALEAKVISLKAVDILTCRTPCYEWKGITVHVKNPFPTGGEFSVVLVESTTFIHLPSQLTETRPRTPHGDKNVSVGECDTSHGCSHIRNSLTTSITSSLFREFFCSVEKLSVTGNGSSSLVLYYLPFNIHTRYCAVILSNKEAPMIDNASVHPTLPGKKPQLKYKIGDLIYVVRGKGLVPLPSNFPPSKDTVPVDYRHFLRDENKEDPVLYLKCKLQHTLHVNIKLPLTNEAKERALAFAAQQQMSAIEYERRLLTGTLESSSVRVAIALLGLTRIESFLLFHLSKLKKPKAISYTTELSLLDYFSIPKEIYIPQIPETHAKLTPSQKSGESGETGGVRFQMQKPGDQGDAEGFISVPIHFYPLGAGRYPCKILLRSKYDVRVFQVEGVVNEDRPRALVQFETRAFENIIQKIPITNETHKEAKFQAEIEGEWFSGPPALYVGPGSTNLYSLSFKPLKECEVTGKLTLKNEVNGFEQICILKGIGKTPQAFGTIVMNCKVGNVAYTSVTVPNYANSIVTYKVSSNLPIVWGDPYITVEPLSSASYVIHMCPWRRGLLQGEISFHLTSVSDLNHQMETYRDKRPSFPETLEPFPIYTLKDSDLTNLRIWYQLEIHTSPEEPLQILEISCIALETTCIEIPLSNPKDETVQINVKLSSPALVGSQELILNPLECSNYILQCSPAAVGYKEESIIFEPKKGEEFWCLLKLTTDLPKRVRMPEISCDLGKYVIQTIPLYNPTVETLKLKVANSNPENFALEIKRSKLVVFPNSTKEISVCFYPSGLGRTGHEACINFYCDEFQEWKFDLCGIGLYPQPSETIKMIAFISRQSSVIIDFRNPTKENVSINITLTNQKNPEHVFIDHCWDSFLIKNSAFKFRSLSQTQGIVLPPKKRICIPVLYLPQYMTLSKSMVIIQMMRENKENWPIDNFDELNTEFKRTMGIDKEEIEAIHWMYPLVGLPQAALPKSLPPLIQCQSNKTIHMTMEVALIGDFFGPFSTSASTEFFVIPKRNSYCNVYEKFTVIPKIREFEYELEFGWDDINNNLDSSVDLCLTKKSYSIKDEMILLVFSLTFAPKKPFRCPAVLKVESVTDGTWKFPLILKANEPEVENVINIYGIGLYKESVTKWRLTSQSSYPETFIAYFLPGNDPGFYVEPTAGVLPPCWSDGIVITVGFKPLMYSKKYKAQLAIQTEETYRLFEINGLPPIPPSLVNVKAKVDSTNNIYDHMPVRQRNFIRENAKILSTGVSSTIKGAPLLTKRKQK